MKNEFLEAHLSNLCDAICIFLMAPAIAFGGVVDCFLHYCNACIELIENVSFVIVGEYERFKDNRRHKREMKDTLAMIRAESIEYVRCLIKNKEKENEDLVKRLKEWEDLGHKYGVWCASRLDEVIQDIGRKR